MENLEQLFTVVLQLFHVYFKLCQTNKMRKIKTGPPYDPAIPLLDIDPKEMKTRSQRDICTHIHCSIIYKSQDMEQPQCPLTDEWIKKM